MAKISIEPRPKCRPGGSAIDGLAMADGAGGVLRAGLLVLGLACALATQAHAQAGGACPGFPHYPRGMTDPKNGSIEFTRDSKDQVVAWFKQHLDGGGPGGAWLLRYKHNRESSTWLFAQDVNHIRIDWRAGVPTVRIRYLCP